MRYLAVLLIVFSIISCNTDEKNVDVSAIEATVDIKRVDLEMAKCSSPEDVYTVLDNNQGLVRSFVQYGIMPDQKVMSNEFWKLVVDGKELFSLVENQLSDVSDIESEFEDAYKHFKYYDPNFREPSTYFLVSGFGGFDVDAKDSTTMIIGSEYFIKEKQQYFPRREEMPYYLYKYYDRNHMTSKVVKRLVKGLYAEFNEKDATLINSMIYWGKVFYMTEHILPKAADSIIVEYSSEEIERVEANRKETYNHFVANQLFFKQDHKAKLKYVDRRPHTNELGDNAPGRIGQYLGWDIVRSYMKNNDVSLMELMADSDHQKIFEKAKYKPK